MGGNVTIKDLEERILSFLSRHWFIPKDMQDIKNKRIIIIEATIEQLIGYLIKKGFHLRKWAPSLDGLEYTMSFTEERIENKDEFKECLLRSILKEYFRRPIERKELILKNFQEFYYDLGVEMWHLATFPILKHETPRLPLMTCSLKCLEKARFKEFPSEEIPADIELKLANLQYLVSNYYRKVFNNYKKAEERLKSSILHLNNAEKWFPNHFKHGEIESLKALVYATALKVNYYLNSSNEDQNKLLQLYMGAIELFNKKAEAGNIKANKMSKEAINRSLEKLEEFSKGDIPYKEDVINIIHLAEMYLEPVFPDKEKVYLYDNLTQ